MVAIGIDEKKSDSNVNANSTIPVQIHSKRPCCASGRQLCALMRKNCLQQCRHKLATICDLICPVIWIGLFCFVYTQFNWKTTCQFTPLAGSDSNVFSIAGGDYDARNWLPDRVLRENINLQLFQMHAIGWKIAIYPDNAKVRDFVTSKLDYVVPGFKARDAFPQRAFTTNPHLDFLNFPKFSEVVFFFRDESALHDYIGAADYHSKPKIVTAINFEKIGIVDNDYKYTIRANRTLSGSADYGHTDVTVTNVDGWIEDTWSDECNEIDCQSSRYIASSGRHITWTRGFGDGDDDDDWWRQQQNCDRNNPKPEDFGKQNPRKMNNLEVPSFSLLQLIIDKAILNQRIVDSNDFWYWISPSWHVQNVLNRNLATAAQLEEIKRTAGISRLSDMLNRMDSYGCYFESLRSGCNNLFYIVNGRGQNQDCQNPTPLTITELSPQELQTFYAQLENFERHLQMVPQKISLSNFPQNRFRRNEFFAQKTILDMASILFVFAFAVPVKNLLNKIVFERESGIREGMKMMGLNDTALIGSWIITYIFQFSVTMAIVTVICQMFMFSNSSTLYLFTFFFCFGISTIAFCYLVSSFFSKATTAGVLGALIFFGTFFTYFSVSLESNEEIVRLVSLTGSAAFGLGIDVISRFEGSEIGITAETFDANGPNHLSLFAFCAHMLFDALLYVVLGRYFELVVPKDKVVTLHPLFFLLPSYWCPGCCSTKGKANKGTMMLAKEQGEKNRVADGLANVNGGHPNENENENGQSHSHFERLTLIQQKQLASNRCVEIRNLRKEFQTADGSTKVAVAGLNAQFFEDEIFVLLGHNGAGKTTTLSMLCGLIAPTDGVATSYGLDIGTQMSKIRQFIGVCPQQNILYTDLTVMEHLMLYCRIKLVPPSKRKSMCNDLLKSVALTEKTNMLTPTLSGGQKRKLCLAISLCGVSKVLYLDEPTSGMDVFAQRSTWNLLQKSKAGRVTIITTHSMEEADVLGDRIGIMANGKMICCGSPLFLKTLYGVGYNLTCTLSQNQSNTSEILRTIKEIVPVAKEISRHGRELSYSLPLASATLFEPLFNRLGKLQSENLLDSFNVSVTTMQEVFLRSAVEAERTVAEKQSDVQLKKRLSSRKLSKINSMKEKENTEADIEDRLKRLNRSMFCTHFFALLATRYHNVKRDLKAFLFQVVIPILALTGGIYLVSSVTTEYSAITPNTKFFNPRAKIESLKEKTNLPFSDFPYSTQQSSLLLNAMNKGKDRKNYAYNLVNFSVIDLIKKYDGKFCLNQSVSQTDAWFEENMKGKDMCDPMIDATIVIDGVCTTCANSPLAMQPGACITAPTGLFCYPASQKSMEKIKSMNLQSEEIFALASHPCTNGNQGDTCKFEITDPNFDPFQSNQNNHAVRIRQGEYALLNLRYQQGHASYDEKEAMEKMENCAMNLHLLDTRANDESSVYTAFSFRGHTDLAKNFVEARLHFNQTAIHGPVVAQNLLTTTLFRTFSNDDNASIEVTNHPMPPTASEIAFQTQVSGFFVVFIVGIAWAFIPAACAEFIVHERFFGVKHQLLVSGVSLPSFWFSNFLWDCLQYIVPASAAIGIFIWMDIPAYTRTEGNSFTTCCTLVALYGPAAIGHSYLLSRFFTKPATAVNSILVMNVLLVIVIIVVFIARMINQNACNICELLRHFVFLTFPGYAFTEGLLRLSLSQVMFTCDEMHNPLVVRPPLPPGQLYPDTWDDVITGDGIKYLGITSIAYPLLCIFLELFRSNPTWRKCLCSCFEPSTVDKPYTADEDVKREEDIMKNGARVSLEDAMVEVRGLRKVYNVRKASGGKSTKAAVKDMWFRIKQGECFGLLGVNGAGKSTTFKMLSGDVLPSSGTALLGGRDVLRQQIAVRRLIGYCPQHNALLPRLTVSEHLYLFARIKGVTDNIDNVVKQLIKDMDLVEFAGKRSSSLSGGNKRKLCVAISLIGNPPVIFLDEPSAGMDPVAKRFMWDLISRMSTESKTTQRLTIILTTHSMEECSALCTRIGIMVDGRLRCLGSEQHLKNRFGEGYQLDVKLKDPRQQKIEDMIRGMGRAVDSLGHISKKNLPVACSSLGDTGLAVLINSESTEKNDDVASVWLLQEALRVDGFLEATQLASWFIQSQWTKKLSAFVSEKLSSSAAIQEQHGGTIRYAVDGLPQHGDDFDEQESKLATMKSKKISLAQMFGLLEKAKNQLNIQDYSLGQTSLEQVFLEFAKKQENDAGNVKGMS
eukprot:g1419.t1